MRGDADSRIAGFRDFGMHSAAEDIIYIHPDSGGFRRDDLDPSILRHRIGINHYHFVISGRAAGVADAGDFVVIAKQNAILGAEIKPVARCCDASHCRLFVVLHCVMHKSADLVHFLAGGEVIDFYGIPLADKQYYQSCDFPHRSIYKSYYRYRNKKHSPYFAKISHPENNKHWQ